MNTKFTVFEKETGRVLFGGTASDASAFETETNGVLVGVEYSTGYLIDDDHHALPEQPSPAHVFNYTTKQWEDPRTLQDFKEARWAIIKQARTAFIDAPLVTPYGTFDSDAAGRNSITDAVLLANNLSALSLPVAIEFTLADNSVVTLDAAQIVEVGLLLGQKVQYAHPHSQALRAQIEAAATKEDVEAVVW